MPSILLRHELYVTAALIAAAAFVILTSAGAAAPWPAIVGFALGFALRAAAILWKLALPPHPGT